MKRPSIRISIVSLVVLLTLGGGAMAWRGLSSDDEANEKSAVLGPEKGEKTDDENNLQVPAPSLELVNDEKNSRLFEPNEAADGPTTPVATGQSTNPAGYYAVPEASGITVSLSDTGDQNDLDSAIAEVTTAAADPYGSSPGAVYDDPTQAVDRYAPVEEAIAGGENPLRSSDPVLLDSTPLDVGGTDSISVAPVSAQVASIDVPGQADYLPEYDQGVPVNDGSLPNDAPAIVSADSYPAANPYPADNNTYTEPASVVGTADPNIADPNIVTPVAVISPAPLEEVNALADGGQYSAQPNEKFLPPASIDLVGQPLDSQLPIAQSVAGQGMPGEKSLEGLQTPSLTIEKVAPREVQVDNPTEIRIKIRNTGRATANRVVVRDQVPQGTDYESSTPPADVEDGHLYWDLGAIKAGDTQTITLRLVPRTEGEFGSVASVSFEAQASVRSVATRPQLTIEHTLPAQVHIGSMVKMKIIVSNPGTGVARDIVLEEDVPRGFSHPAGDSLEFEVGTLKPGQSKELELTLKAVAAGVIDHIVHASGEGVLAAEDRQTIEIIAPQLVVDMKGPSKRFLNRKATYSVTLANPGTAAAKDIELVAHLPLGMKFVSADNHGQHDAKHRAIYWSLEELPAGENTVVKLTVTPTQMGLQQLRIESRSESGLSDKTEHALQVDGLAALLFEVADVDDPVEVGGTTTYEVRVVNQGSKAATNIVVTAAVPAGMVPLSGKGPTRGTIRDNLIVFAPLKRLAPRADALFKIQVKATQDGDHRMRIQIQSAELTSPVTKEESTRVYSDE